MKSLFAFLLLTVLFAGCSTHSGEKGNESVVAVVNGKEITRREVDFFYQRNPVASKDTTVVLNQRRNILGGLVRAELLAQQAEELKLDKSPEFVLAMHDARRRVLAGLAEEKLTESVQPVSAQDAERFIAQNTYAFSQRKLIVYDEVLISGVDLPLLESLDAQAEKGASLSQLVAAVNAKGVPFRQIRRTLSTDQIAPPITNVLMRVRPNVPAVVRVGDRVSIILVVRTVVPVPLEGKIAMQAASSMLQTGQRNGMVAAKMREKLDDAKITYFGEFSASAVAADSAGLAKNVLPLPAPDPDRVRDISTHRFRLAVSLAVSIFGAMLLFVFSKTIVAGKVWTPRLWPMQKNSDTSAGYEFDVYAVSAKVKLILFVAAVLGVLLIGYQFILIRGEVPVQMMIYAIVAGIVAALGGSFVFSLSALRQLTTKFRWFLLWGSLLSILVAVLVTMRVVFL